MQTEISRINELNPYHVDKSTDGDIRQIVEWLAADREGNQGFWHNRDFIVSMHEAGEVRVIRVDGEAVAFCASSYGQPQILAVRTDYRRKGMGSTLVQAVADNSSDETSFLDIEVNPSEAEAFWRTQGFERYADPYSREIKMRRPLWRGKVLDVHQFENTWLERNSEMPSVWDFPLTVYVDVAMFDYSGRVVKSSPARREDDGSITLFQRIFHTNGNSDSTVTITVVDEDGNAQSYQEYLFAKAVAELGILKGTESERYIDVFKPVKRLEIAGASERLATYAASNEVINLVPLAA